MPPLRSVGCSLRSPLNAVLGTRAYALVRSRGRTAEDTLRGRLTTARHLKELPGRTPPSAWTLPGRSGRRETQYDRVSRLPRCCEPPRERFGSGLAVSERHSHLGTIVTCLRAARRVPSSRPTLSRWRFAHIPRTFCDYPYPKRRVPAACRRAGRCRLPFTTPRGSGLRSSIGVGNVLT